MKFNEFCEKYETALWMLVAALWFLLGFAFQNQESATSYMLGSGVFWIIFAVFEFWRIYMRNKKNGGKKTEKGEKSSK